MKKMMVAIGILCLATPTFAINCVHTMPLSTYTYSVANNGAGSKEMDCSKIPGEDCVCLDERIVDWTVATVVDLYEDDPEKPVYSTECPQGQEGCEPVGYDQNYWGKKAVNDPVKLQAFKDAKASAESDRIQKLQSAQNAAEALKTCLADADADFDSPTTIAGVKTQLKAFKSGVRSCLVNLIKSRGVQ